MIVEVEQYYTGKDMLWMFSRGDRSVCAALLPVVAGEFNVRFDFNGGDKLNLYYNPTDTRFGTSLRERLSYKVFEDERLVSIITNEYKKCKGLFQSYEYAVMEFNGDKYCLYEVGLWKDGLFLCLYQNDRLVAIAEKELTTVNFKGKYHVYIEDETCIEPLFLMMIRYDITKYAVFDEVAIHSKKIKLVKTVQKELNAKFDPEFIERVKAQEGITY